MPDLNYRIVKEGNEISYKVEEGVLSQIHRYPITNTMTEDKALFEILYAILNRLDLSPADLATTVTPLHSEIMLREGNDFTFYQTQQSTFDWAHTRR